MKKGVGCFFPRTFLHLLHSFKFYEGWAKIFPFGQEGNLDVLVENLFELIPVPAAIRLLSLHNKSGILSNPIPQGFIESCKGLDVNQFDAEAVFIEPR